MLDEYVEKENPAPYRPVPGESGTESPDFPEGYAIRHDIPQNVITASLSYRLELMIGGGVLDQLGWYGSTMHLTLLQDQDEVAPCIVQDEKGAFAHSTADHNGFGLRPPVRASFLINKALERAFMKAGVSEEQVELGYRLLPDGRGIILDLTPVARDQPAPVLDTPADAAEPPAPRRRQAESPIWSDIAGFLGGRVEVPSPVLLGMVIVIAFMLIGQAIRAKSDSSMSWTVYEQTSAMRDLDRSIRDLRDLEANFRPRSSAYSELPDIPLAPLEQGRPVQDLPQQRLYEAPTREPSGAKPAISTGAK